MPEKMTEGELYAFLERRYNAPTWALFPQVPNATGGRKTRTADAVAMGLWPSRGLELHGFEIKVSRSDWLRELKKPKKSAPIQGYCDRWWIVVPDRKTVDIDAGELPQTWGLLVPRARALVAVKDAPKLDPDPLERPFIAALLRRAHESFGRKNGADPERRRLREQIRSELHDHYKTMYGADLTHKDGEIKRLNQELERYKEAERVAGIRINRWNAEKLSKTIKLMTNGGAKQLLDTLQDCRDGADRVLQASDEVLAELRERVAEQENSSR